MPIDFYFMEVSAPCRAVMMTAKMIGVELNMKSTNLMAGDHMKPEFLAINPQHNVPTIDDDGFYLNESKAISAYLVNRYAKDDALYPKDPKFRALVDQRLYFDMGVLYRRFGELYYPVMMNGATKLSETAKKQLSEAIDFLEGFLGNNKYAAGDRLTIADIALVSTVSTIEAVDKTHLENRPKILAWMETCKSEIVDYEECNQKGAEMFGQWANSSLSKLESA